MLATCSAGGGCRERHDSCVQLLADAIRGVGVHVAVERWVEELDQFELVDALACELDSSTVQTASSVLCQLRLALKRTDS